MRRAKEKGSEEKGVRRVVGFEEVMKVNERDY